jgi:glycerol uptake facilitator-like aquaporin
VYFTYREAIEHFEGATRTLATAGIWATYPQDFLTNFPGGLIDQIVGTAMLLIVIFAITDERNLLPTAALGPATSGWR